MTLKELLNVTSPSTRITVKKDEKILIDRELLSEIYYTHLIKPYLSETIERITAKQPYDIEITLKNKSIKEIKQEAYKEFAERLKEKKIQSTMDKRICTFEMIDGLLNEMVE